MGVFIFVFGFRMYNGLMHVLEVISVFVVVIVEGWILGRGIGLGWKMDRVRVRVRCGLGVWSHG
jgi:hypothetical protein